MECLAASVGARLVPLQRPVILASEAVPSLQFCFVTVVSDFTPLLVSGVLRVDHRLEAWPPVKLHIERAADWLAVHKASSDEIFSRPLVAGCCFCSWNTALLS